MNDRAFWNATGYAGARFFLAVILLFSGYMKSLDIEEFVQVIYRIEFISLYTANIAALVILFSELVIGSMLLIGLFTKQALYASFLLLSLFTLFLLAALSFVWEVKSCGCFGRLSRSDISIFDVIRNMVLLMLNYVLIIMLDFTLKWSIDRIASSPNRQDGNTTKSIGE